MRSWCLAQRWATPDKNKLIIKILIWQKQCAWKMTHASNIKLNGGIYGVSSSLIDFLSPRHHPFLRSRLMPALAHTHTHEQSLNQRLNESTNWNKYKIIKFNALSSDRLALASAGTTGGAHSPYPILQYWINGKLKSLHRSHHHPIEVNGVYVHRQRDSNH